MPFTISHLGPALFLEGIGYKIFNFWALILGSVAADIEALIFVIFNNFIGCPNCTNHGFFHSILGAVVGSLLLAVLLWFLREKLEKISLKIKIKQSFSFPILFFSSFIAWLIHILFDSLTHYDVFLLWPFKKRFLYFGPGIYWQLSWILFFIGMVGLILIYINYKKQKDVRP